MADSTHQVKIVRIDEIQKHPNADTLGLVHIGGYQCVVKLGEFKAGDLAVYVQPDSVVPDTYTWAWLWNNETFEGGVPIRKRRVTVRKFRKEWSEGLLLPLRDFSEPHGLPVWKEGEDVAELLGITHYEPEEDIDTRGKELRFKSGRPKSLKGWLFYAWYYFLGLLGFGDPLRGRRSADPALPVYDVESYKNFNNVFKEGDPVLVTEKIHGSNGRFIFTKGKMYAGSRKLWKAEDSTCVWRQALKDNPWIEEWCRANPDYALYGEVAPTQKFKNGAKFHYGCSENQIKFCVFDILLPNGKWASYDSLLEVVEEQQPYGLGPVLDNWVPQLYHGLFNNDIFKLVDGQSTLAGHIREGIVIRSTTESEQPVHGLGRKQLKVVSNAFLEAS